MNDSTTTSTIAPPAIPSPAIVPIDTTNQAVEPPSPAASVPAGETASGRPTASPGPVAASQDAARSTLWLTDRDIVVFTMLAALVLVLLVARWLQLTGWGSREIEIERLTPVVHAERLDLNRAGWVELSQLDGVGEALARRIVDDRRANGAFRSVDELDRVKGIGPRTIERLRRDLAVEHDVVRSSPAMPTAGR